jgi:hypothetical protein
MTQSTKIEIPTFDNTRNPRTMAIQIGFLIFLFLLILGGCVGYFLFSDTNQHGQRVVSFRIEGTGGTARVTYTEIDGHQIDPVYISVPWESPGKYYRSGLQVYLTAGSTQANGTITCVMKLDGQEWKRETSSSNNGKVACGGIVP